MQRKDNVFAFLMIEDGHFDDAEDFYKDERSNIMAIVYKQIADNSDGNYIYDCPMGDCLSWYDETCKAFMEEGLNKTIASRK